MHMLWFGQQKRPGCKQSLFCLQAPLQHAVPGVGLGVGGGGGGGGGAGPGLAGVAPAPFVPVHPPQVFGQRLFTLPQ